MAYMQPCSLKRKLRLFPQLSKAKLTAKLGPNSALWQQLPGELKQVQQPCLWKAGTQLTLLVIATACLTALFLSLRYEAAHVGYWMVQATAAQKDELRVGQKAAGYASSTNCEVWWKQCMKADFQGKAPELRDKLNEQAALALFLNPPVSRYKAGQSKHACMCLKSGFRAGRNIDWHKGYPWLVLQHACVGDDGTHYRQIRVPAHQLVALFFLGPNPQHVSSLTSARNVVCHYDVPPAVLKVTWDVSEKITPNIKRCEPVNSRCVSKGCVCPLCLHYDSQSINAQTGRQRQQLTDRKSRQKK